MLTKKRSTSFDLPTAESPRRIILSAFSPSSSRWPLGMVAPVSMVKPNGSRCLDVGKLTDADEFGNRIRETRVGASVTGQANKALQVGV